MTLLITATPHADGVTQQLVLKLCENYSVDAVIDVFKKLPLPCIDCGFCKENTSCALRDLDEEYKLVEQADTVIFAFPVYNMSLPSPLKALIERFQVYYNAHFSRGIEKPINISKRIGVIITSGSSDEFSKTVCVSQIKQAFSVMSGEVESVFWKKDTDSSPVSSEDFERLVRLFSWL